jgi:hypothetical protein
MRQFFAEIEKSCLFKRPPLKLRIEGVQTLDSRSRVTSFSLESLLYCFYLVWDGHFLYPRIVGGVWYVVLAGHRKTPLTHMSNNLIRNE